MKKNRKKARRRPSAKPKSAPPAATPGQSHTSQLPTSPPELAGVDSPHHRPSDAPRKPEIPTPGGSQTEKERAQEGGGNKHHSCVREKSHTQLCVN